MAARLARMVGGGEVHVVAVHGWMGGHRLFEPLFDLIDPHRFTYAFLDCRGYGERVAEPGPCTIEAIAADVLTVADDLSWDGFHVAGHSMGGMAAQRLMLDVPARIRSAVLIAPVPACGARVGETRRALLEHAIADTGARRELIEINTGRVRDRGWVDELLALSLATTQASALAGYLEAWNTTDFAADVHGLRTPVLTLAGELDAAAPAQRMKETILAWYPNASLEVMPGVGHYPMREDPHGLARRLDGYFGGGIPPLPHECGWIL